MEVDEFEGVRGAFAEFPDFPVRSKDRKSPKQTTTVNIVIMALNGEPSIPARGSVSSL